MFPRRLQKQLLKSPAGNFQNPSPEIQAPLPHLRLPLPGLQRAMPRRLAAILPYQKHRARSRLRLLTRRRHDLGQKMRFEKLFRGGLGLS